MRQTLIISCLVFLLLVIYKHQHIQPVDDPKESPLFRETLERSLDKFKKGEVNFRKAEEKKPEIPAKPPELPVIPKQKTNVARRPPSPMLQIAGSPQKGSISAPVTIVVFTDFKCVHCADWAKTLDEVIRAFPYKIKVVFKNFPLPLSQYSEIAAKAALAAREQGKFWEMHDLLFRNRANFDDQAVFTFASELGLDMSRFREALSNPHLAQQIEQDKAQARQLGLTGAPTSFINGQMIKGSKPLGYVQAVIERLLSTRR